MKALRDVFWKRGWCCVQGVLPSSSVARLERAVDEIIDSSRQVSTNTEAFALASGHSEESPRVRKVMRPHLWHPAFLETVYDAGILDIVTNLFPRRYWDADEGRREEKVNGGSPVSSPGLRFQGDKIVLKMGGQEAGAVVCHQDWVYYPHSNDDLCTVSVVLEDMTPGAGGLCFVPGSHEGPVYEHHLSGEDHSGHGPVFIGGIKDSRFEARQLKWDAVHCPRGSIIVHHVRTVHASPASAQGNRRPLLLFQYASADAWPLQQHSRGAWGIDLPPGHQMDDWDLYLRGLVVGSPVVRPRLEAVPASLPLQWPGRGKEQSLFSQLRQVEKQMEIGVDEIDWNRSSAHAQYSSLEKRPRVELPRSTHRIVDVRRSNGLEWQRLLQFVGGGPYGVLYGHKESRLSLQQRLMDLVESEPDVKDEGVYDELRAFYHSNLKPTDSVQRILGSRADERVMLRAKEVVGALHSAQSRLVFSGAEKEERCVLDLGCGDGKITGEVGKLLQLKPHQVHGCDDQSLLPVSDTDPLCNAETSSFTFTRVLQHPGLTWETRRILPYEDNSMDLVYSLMTLHHIRRRKETLDEIRRVLKPGGILLFREHDVISPCHAAVLDVVHGFHLQVWSQTKEGLGLRPADWMSKDFSSFYSSKLGWNLSLTAAGLRPLYEAMGRHHNPETVRVLEEDKWRLTSKHELSCLSYDEAQEILEGRDREGDEEGWSSRTTSAQLLHFNNLKSVFFGIYVK